MRRRRLGAATLVVLLAATVTAATAVPLFLGGRAGLLVSVHVVAAAVFFAALGVKLALLGARARPGRARRLWPPLVAQMGSLLAGYTLLTGVLVVLDPAWSNQHLAASFWLGVVVVVHARQYARRLRALLRRSPPSGDLELRAALRRLDAPTIALLDLSVRKGMSDSDLATISGADIAEMRHRREHALERLNSGGGAIERRLRRLAPEAWSLPARRRAARRLVVVGGGMAGHAIVEQMLARGGWRIVLLAEEDVEPYNRIGLSQVLRDRRSSERLALHRARWYADADVDLRLGIPATAVEVDRRRVIDGTGTEHRYDALILATGSRAFIPPIPGVELGHVVGYRTLRDAQRIAATAGHVRTAAVIGGGLLGLEAAATLSDRGLAVTVVQAGGRLMAQQLDDGAASLLRRSLARRGLETVVATTVSEITASHLRLADGSTVTAQLVIVAAGIRAETALARAAGLDVDRGIIVDDHMRTSAAEVWAVGECAQHRGVVHGLWAPVAEQVRAAVASLDGDSMPFTPSAPQTTLKVAGLELFAAGRTTLEDDEEEVVRSDGRSGRYAKLVVDGDRLVGAILLGDTTMAGRLGQLIAAGGPVPVDVLDASVVTRCVERPRGELPGPDEVVCHCMAVSREPIERAIDRDGLQSVDGVAAATGAGTGCGSCAATVARILDERRRFARPPAQPSVEADSENRSDWASA